MTETISDKVAHVKKAKQIRDHACHWTGCRAQVPPAMAMCRDHWFKLPKRLRKQVWATYTVGQEEDTRLVSPEYLSVMREVKHYIDELGEVYL